MDCISVANMLYAFISLISSEQKKDLSSKSIETFIWDKKFMIKNELVSLRKKRVTKSSGLRIMSSK